MGLVCRGPGAGYAKSRRQIFPIVVESLGAHLHRRVFVFGVTHHLPSNVNTLSKTLLGLVVDYCAVSCMVSTGLKLRRGVKVVMSSVEDVIL